MDLATGAVTTIAGSSGASGSLDGTGAMARFNRPLGIALGRSDELYVADNQNHAIRKLVLSTGAVTTLVGAAAGPPVVLGPLPAGLSFPTSVAVGPNGELFITDEDALLQVR